MAKLGGSKASRFAKGAGSKLKSAFSKAANKVGKKLLNQEEKEELIISARRTTIQLTGVAIVISGGARKLSPPKGMVVDQKNAYHMVARNKNHPLRNLAKAVGKKLAKASGAAVQKAAGGIKKIAGAPKGPKAG